MRFLVMRLRRWHGVLPLLMALAGCSAPHGESPPEGDDPKKGEAHVTVRTEPARLAR